MLDGHVFFQSINQPNHALFIENVLPQIQVLQTHRALEPLAYGEHEITIKIDVKQSEFLKHEHLCECLRDSLCSLLADPHITNFYWLNWLLVLFADCFQYLLELILPQSTSADAYRFQRVITTNRFAKNICLDVIHLILIESQTLNGAFGTN